MVCSLLFQAWVITDMQSWHSESWSSHSSVGDSRAGRAREKIVEDALQKCSGTSEREREGKKKSPAQSGWRIGE
jgi:hypothetical protein